MNCQLFNGTVLRSTEGRLDLKGTMTPESLMTSRLTQMIFHGFLWIAPCVTNLLWAQTPAQSPHRFEGVVARKVAYDYLQFLPAGYEEGSTHQWPLMLFLHGAGERGNDLEKVKQHGPPRRVDSDPDFPFVLISPQCPEGQVWDADALLGLLDEVVDRLNIDTKRVYVTGLSMGGFGTWNLIAKDPGRFAAAAPICGGASTRDFLLPHSRAALESLPIWVFHGEKDTVVLPEESKRLVAFFQSRLQGRIKLTLYPEAGHDSWTATYANPELYQWMLEQRR